MKLHLKIKCYKLRKLQLKIMQIRTILYQYIKTLIKHVFLLNFTHELLMSFRKGFQSPRASLKALGLSNPGKLLHLVL